MNATKSTLNVYVAITHNEPNPWMFFKQIFSFGTTRLFHIVNKAGIRTPLKSSIQNLRKNSLYKTSVKCNSLTMKMDSYNKIQ